MQYKLDWDKLTFTSNKTYVKFHKTSKKVENSGFCKIMGIVEDFKNCTL